MDGIENELNQQLYKGKYRIKSARASWCDYNDGLFFVTICTLGKKHYLGEIFNGKMILNELGFLVHNCILNMEQLHQNVLIPHFVVMPNHVHMIICLTSDIASGSLESSFDGYSSDVAGFQKIANRCGRLSHLISQFKSVVTKYAKQNHMEFGWQPRFHDHIIRTQDSLETISDYIQNNVYKWDTDCFNDTLPESSTKGQV